MQNTKKVVALVSAVLTLSTVTASAEWVPAGYDTRNLNDIRKVYNEVIGGKYTSKTKFEKLPASAQEWKFEGYELAYPHAGYDRLYLEGNAQCVTKYNNLFPQWETRFADYFWELYGSHRIYQRQQTKIPNVGWRWDYSDDEYVDNKLFVPTTRNAEVKTSWQKYGVGPFTFEGKLVDEKTQKMYERFGVNAHEFYYDKDTKDIVDYTFFSDENLSRRDIYGQYVVTDAEIADHAASIMTKVLTGPSYRGDNGTKVVAKEYLTYGDAWAWDYDSLIYAGAEVSWTGVMYEMAEPYNMYQYLIINGIVFDGHNDLPRIFRFTGGKACPKVEWKYAFSEAAYPFSVVEQKYVDGKVAKDADGNPIYRIPTGEYANSYVKVTDTEIQIWLKDAKADVMVAKASREHKFIGYYDAYTPASVNSWN